MQPCQTRSSPCPTENGGQIGGAPRKISGKETVGLKSEARQRVSWSSGFCGVRERGGRAVGQRPVQSACER